MSDPGTGLRPCAVCGRPASTRVCWTCERRWSFPVDPLEPLLASVTVLTTSDMSGVEPVRAHLERAMEETR